MVQIRYLGGFENAKVKYFNSGKLPTIAETIALYREQKIGLVMFAVDSEFEMGRRRIPNEEVAEAAAANSDMMLAFASIDPHKGKLQRAHAAIANMRAIVVVTEENRASHEIPGTDCRVMGPKDVDAMVVTFRAIFSARAVSIL
jgi:predicted TIM-barrel fold metal-dependent hydrolase